MTLRASKLLPVVIAALLLIAFAMGLTAAAQSPVTPGRLPSRAPSAIRSIPETPQWIWSPFYSKDQIPRGACFFRKAFNVPTGATVRLAITCDDGFTAFVNGQQLGTGDDWKTVRHYDLKNFIRPGVNLIAVKGENTIAGSAGMLTQISVTTATGDIRTFSDQTWKTSLTEFRGWEQPGFNDAQWRLARSFGPSGGVSPWNDTISLNATPAAERFRTSAEFRVEQVLSTEVTGGVIAMTFNEWGEAILSQEDGPLLLAIDKDGNGILDTITTYCDLLKNTQGLLALNGRVFAVGEGPQGPALYVLSDDDNDGSAETVRSLIEFDGPMNEHGPHAPVLGPDGYVYVIVGNHTKLKKPFASSSPHRHYYEGDLVRPKYEDAGGHAVGVTAPGGVVLRTDAEGATVEVVAGGLRNAYDMAFNERGELFTFDSDMEWDSATPWYRPTRIDHITSGAEFGWRSGWSKWPDYYPDMLPPVVNLGRGSPTGMIVYEHRKLPQRYHHCLFAGDWAQGRILAVHLTPKGASYSATSEVFVQGNPLNVTDIDVGSDGWLYFCCGGRGTDGGLYRVVYTGPVPPWPDHKGTAAAIRQPQLQSAWARQNIALIQQELGDTWNQQTPAVAENTRYQISDRLRALDLMQLFGPLPSDTMLIKLSKDSNAEMRAKCAYLMGLQLETTVRDRLVELLADSDPLVRRLACEAFVRGGFAPPAAELVKLLADSDVHVAWAARRALERAPVDEWKSQVLETENAQVFLNGSISLLTLDADFETVEAIIIRGSQFMYGYMPDDQFIDLLRVFQLALIEGQLSGPNVPDLRDQLAKEFPSANPAMNRELMRLIAHLKPDDAEMRSRLIKLLNAPGDATEKLHVGMYARFLEGWSSDDKFALLDFYELARKTAETGHSFNGYLSNVSRDFVGGFTADEQRQVLATGEHWPSAALAVLPGIAGNIDAAVVEMLITLDGKVATRDDDDVKKLQTGIVAVLAMSETERAMSYLRDQYAQSPARRPDLAMGLAQQPGGENWPLLIECLPSLEGASAQEVLQQLTLAEQTPDEPEPYRQAILAGLRLGDDGGTIAANLLAHWTHENPAAGSKTASEQLAAWQKWFTQTYPEAPAPELPTDPDDARWTYNELLTHLTETDIEPGAERRGGVVFAKASCVKCHKHGSLGEGLGPDLTTVAKRFQTKEILTATLYPSHVISDQYASRTLVTRTGLTYVGIVGAGPGESVVVLQANGQKVTLAKDDIEEILPNKKSVMPEGLLDQLSLEEITDLFAYLKSSPDSMLASPIPDGGQR